MLILRLHAFTLVPETVICLAEKPALFCDVRRQGFTEIFVQTKTRKACTLTVQC